jgi:hypothetical protein
MSRNRSIACWDDRVKLGHSPASDFAGVDIHI